MAWSACETFEIFVDDDRYSVPTLHLIQAADEAIALQIARRLLEESPHHLGVELCRSGSRLTGLGAFACRRAAPVAFSSGACAGD